MEQSERPGLSQDALRECAKLAGVRFSEARLERILPRVEHYLEEMDSLEEVDVTEVEPAISFFIKQEEKDGE